MGNSFTICTTRSKPDCCGNIRKTKYRYERLRIRKYYSYERINKCVY